MKRIQITVDDTTLELLARIGEHFGIDSRSTVIRFITRQVARENGLDEKREEHD